MKGSKIGLFDSGVGGLTILKAVAKSLPQYDYVFYGDTANLPLGDKSEEEIFNLTKAGVEELFSRDCALVIIACNTASAETLRRLQDTFLAETYPDRRILGVIIPTIEELIKSGARHALLIATRRTVESGKYERELQKSGSAITLQSIAAPELVPLIEAGKSVEAADLALQAVQAEINQSPEIDTVILGCTHYTKLKDDLRRALGAKTKILSQDEIIPDRVADYLNRHSEIESRLYKTESGGGKRDIVLTENRSDYAIIASELLGGLIV